MDPQLQEVVKQIADAVDKRLAKRFDDAEARLASRFEDAETRLVTRFEQAETRLVTRFEEAETRLVTRFEEAETRLATGFEEAETRLADGAKAHMEELRELVKLSAEGYGATLERIEGELKAMNTKVDTKFADHEKILRRHTLEINALKRQQAARRSSRR